MESFEKIKRPQEVLHAKFKNFQDNYIVEFGDELVIKYENVYL